MEIGRFGRIQCVSVLGEQSLAMKVLVQRLLVVGVVCTLREQEEGLGLISMHDIMTHDPVLQQHTTSGEGRGWLGVCCMRIAV